MGRAAMRERNDVSQAGAGAPADRSRSVCEHTSAATPDRVVPIAAQGSELTNPRAAARSRFARVTFGGRHSYKNASRQMGSAWSQSSSGNNML